MKVFEIEKDGLPNMDDNNIVGRVAFIWDGNIVSGWPLKDSSAEHSGKTYTADEWEADSDVGRIGVFAGVKKYVLFDVPVWEL